MISFLNTIILLGCVQGLIVSCLLFFSKKNKRANRLLAILILLISLASFNLYGEYMNWFGSALLRFITQLVPLVIVMPMGPLIYFYTKSSLDPDFTITRKQRWHFYPVLIDLVPSLTVIFFIIGVVTKLIKNKPGPWGSFIDNYNVYADIPRWAVTTFYVWLSAKYLRYRKKNTLLSGHTAHFGWLQQFIRAFVIFLAIWFVFLVPYIIPKYTDRLLDTFEWYPIYIPMTILIYWLGIKGYIVSQQQAAISKKTAEPNNTLSPALIQQVTTALTKAMEDNKIFLNPALTVATVSETTGIAQKNISAVLNQYLQKSFNEYVNGYRIAAFKEKILIPEMQHLTIAGVAQECGFNSQATFQRTFKELTGKSPSEFRKTAQPTE